MVFIYSEYMLARYHVRMNEARAYLGNKCAKCEITENLEIDHINPTTKLLRISRSWSSRPEIFWTEIKKCQLLCNEHHKQKTIEEKSVEHGGGVSGKRNCKCTPCKTRKAEYMRNYKKGIRNN